MTVVDDRQVEPTIGGDSRSEALNEGDQRCTECIVVKADAAAELQKVAQESCGDVHSYAPRKRIRPLIVSRLSVRQAAEPDDRSPKRILEEGFLGLRH